jgi:putative phage-type endonuclease
VDEINVDLSWGDSPEDKQNSKAWLEWRRSGIGASDAPIIMEKSPYKTVLDLWKDKTGVAEEQKMNPAMMRGHLLEDKARKLFEQRAFPGMEFPAKTFDNGLFRCSMDGWNESEKIGLEIKCPGKEDHDAARCGKVPDKYFYQIQHQYMVTDAKTIFYCSYSEDETGEASIYWLPVPRDSKKTIPRRQPIAT